MTMAKSMLALLLIGAACNAQQIDSMEAQPTLRPFAASELFDDHRAMRTPPAGTLSREAARDNEQSRPPLTWTSMARGKTQFDYSCAACHGIAGDGDSVVADKMSLRKPPSLFEPRIGALSDTRLFAIVTDGYGMMPRFGDRFTPEERWGIIDYVRALQLSRHAPADELGDDLQARLRASDNSTAVKQ